MDDKILPDPVPPEKLKEAALRGLLVPFVGAGASMLAGCPNWKDFADGCLRFFVEKGKLTYSQLDQVNHLHPRIKLTLAKSLQTEHKLSIEFEKVLYPEDRTNDAKGRKLYSALSQLAKTFVTTNYDKWLDTEIVPPLPLVVPDPVAATTPLIDTPRAVIHRIEDFTPNRLSQPRTVIHLHGCLLDPRKMILTTHDYVNHYRNDRLTSGKEENLVLTFLDTLFNNHTVLFVGYGLDELDILEYVIGKARQQQPGPGPKELRHYLLQGFHSHESELMKMLKVYYAECGIHLIPFLRDHKDWDQLIEVLEDFARAMPAAEMMKSEKLIEMEDLLNG